MDRLGVKTCAFHLGDYRRATLGPGRDVPDDYFFVNGLCITSELDWNKNTNITNFILASPSSVELRKQILQKCREDLYRFLDEEKGQIAIYDAVNPTAAGRRSLAREFAKHDILVYSIALYMLNESG